MSQTECAIKRVILSVRGTVQGVGFRPFIYRLANGHGLCGSIKNCTAGVEIDLQGPSDILKIFKEELLVKKPIGAVIAELNVKEVPLIESAGFQILESEFHGENSVPLIADRGICAECLVELFDESNRRYRYPFIHCTSCGPRFSLVRALPFDRMHTSMHQFTMCAECEKEYHSPGDRRFYSQTNCCPNCGPQLSLVDVNRTVIANHESAIEIASDLLRAGKILALKNTGGFLLLADASNHEAVCRLRHRKRRPAKPFALMMPNCEAVALVAELNQQERETLSSAAAPIVLLKKRRNSEIDPAVADDSPYYGVMLPHSGLHHMLFRYFDGVLVATSGNRSGVPLCITEEEAFDALAEIADAFLIHDRKIIHRLDDSIVQHICGRPLIMRKARGYVPSSILLPEYLRDCQIDALFATGSHMKNSFAFLKGRHIYSSQHMGDLETADCSRNYDQTVAQWESFLGLTPKVAISDIHPEYYGNVYCEKRGLNTLRIQHHRAHVYSGMASQHLRPPFLALAWDGTGWGDEMAVWGGEGFIVEPNSIRRVASLYPFMLPGGEKAVKEPRRSMLGLLYALSSEEVAENYSFFINRDFRADEIVTLISMMKKGLHSPICSSTGRLFDGVSALLGLCSVSDFEGQAAMRLEWAACQSVNRSVSYKIPLLTENNLFLLDWRLMIKQIFDDLMEGIASEEIAFAFHEALARGILELAMRTGVKDVLLTGGVMQNRLLAETSAGLLDQAGFNVHWPIDVPPNDGGISVGQIIGVLFENKT